MLIWPQIGASLPLGQVVQQVGLAQIVDLMSEVVSHPADGARIRVDRLRLQALEFQVLLVQFVVCSSCQNSSLRQRTSLPSCGTIAFVMNVPRMRGEVTS